MNDSLITEVTNRLKLYPQEEQPQVATHFRDGEERGTVYLFSQVKAGTERSLTFFEAEENKQSLYGFNYFEKKRNESGEFTVLLEGKGYSNISCFVRYLEDFLVHWKDSKHSLVDMYDRMKTSFPR